MTSLYKVFNFALWLNSFHNKVLEIIYFLHEMPVFLRLVFMIFSFHGMDIENGFGVTLVVLKQFL